MDNILYTILCTLDRQSLIRKKELYLQFQPQEYSNIFFHILQCDIKSYIRDPVFKRSYNMYPIIQPLVLWITIFSDL